LLQQFAGKNLKVTILDQLTPDIIAKADIITNPASAAIEQ
jgi:hypothetical protein